MFCTTICGYGWLTQSSVDQVPAQVSEYRILRLPPPLRVIKPPPSSTTRCRVLITLAVDAMTMMTGLGPQSKVMMPPAATSRTTAADVQLAGRPSPITWSGCRVLTARPAGGTWKCPAGLPKSGITGAGFAATAVVATPASTPSNIPTPASCSTALMLIRDGSEGACRNERDPQPGSSGPRRPVLGRQSADRRRESSSSASSPWRGRPARRRRAPRARAARASSAARSDRREDRSAADRR